MIRLRKKKGCSRHNLTSLLREDKEATIGLFNPLTHVFFLLFSSFLPIFSFFFHISFSFPCSILKLYSPLPCPYASCCNIWNNFFFISFISSFLFLFYCFYISWSKVFLFVLLYFCFLGCMLIVWRKKTNLILLQIYIFHYYKVFFSFVFFFSSFNFLKCVLWYLPLFFFSCFHSF